MPNLWTSNHPRCFWQCQPSPPDEVWDAAIQTAYPLLGLGTPPTDAEAAFALTLGEARFGPDHWMLPARLRLYYLLKPAIPRAVARGLRRALRGSTIRNPPANWPIDPRYVSFQIETLRQAMLLIGARTARYRSLWPNGSRFALVLTHDIETGQGQCFVRKVAELEQSLGFRSCFNFVLDRYPLDLGLMQELRARGFEVGCHGLKHDGKLFSSHSTFKTRADILNGRMRDYGMVGFRSPLTHRHPAWMQILEMEYDSSFFDVDPLEPVPGGSMSIWPFFIGRFVELPYTLIQDYTLNSVLGEETPRLWLEKVDFIERYHGLALLNSHPDYLRNRKNWDCYSHFLQQMLLHTEAWAALPRDAARWWRARAQGVQPGTTTADDWSLVSLADDGLAFASASTTANAA